MNTVGVVMTILGACMATLGMVSWLDREHSNGVIAFWLGGGVVLLLIGVSLVLR